MEMKSKIVLLISLPSKKEREMISYKWGIDWISDENIKCVLLKWTVLIKVSLILAKYLIALKFTVACL